MHENRTVYPQKKAQLYQQLQELPKKYKVMALVRMEKVRSSQLLPLRKKFLGQVEVISIKDKVAKKALSTLSIPGLQKLVESLTGQCVLMFTNMSPFKLNVLLGKNKVMMYARGGDIASIDVIVPAKNTGIAPGPMLTEFKEAGIPTKIDQGTIWILKDSTPVKKGQPVPEKLATLLQKLDIKTVEAGILLDTAIEDGIQYKKEELIIDLEQYRNLFAQAHQEAVSLSIEAAYITADNIKQVLAKAAQGSRSVAIEAGYMTDETKEQVLQRANARAQAVASKAKGYTPA
ncbi:MAG: 50S ribosomal protein L10 [Candidatus Nitrosotenuis sp.]|uniref:Large ribosomal subunit protein uL10 n=1 Tax=Candidatus Nitrosotenuis uzonensis TaxID=1407055 RepID=A0A812EX49_9ARCH|nr:50S ribosomal protein L10 [Candidatus Nitrosotenuis uzonensis]MCA2003560.1 50S ribosomal protein L10 [Candidatus Nitrosotenuis sp.]CAE6485455.1 50S ribosomal protein L10 [Candidatus Nitrosotenuis uzonensis]